MLSQRQIRNLRDLAAIVWWILAFMSWGYPSEDWIGTSLFIFTIVWIVCALAEALWKVVQRKIRGEHVFEW